MRFRLNVLGQLIEPINRRHFQSILDRDEGNADKPFRSNGHRRRSGRYQRGPELRFFEFGFSNPTTEGTMTPEHRSHATGY
ncbi:hypothetical protein NKH70_30265 [Mesorhizobium sp. M0991]|uniref:hypothetical protein n=1 Tax=Mesorhizobium sp. M0991 TaxID=2957043 RepID=UPI00333E0D5E